MRITQQDILKAIKKEKLKGGSFIHRNKRDKVDAKCKVCAVGAVLRQKEIENENILDVASNICSSNVSSGGYLEWYLEDRDYLSALSIKFERLYKWYGGGQKTKTLLTKFVKESFPKSFSVKI